MFPSIEQLARDIDGAWSRRGYSDAEFSAIAAGLLSRPLDLDFENLARCVCAGTDLPMQRRLDQGFGQPAITLFRDERFLVEALCWHTSTPAIHHHAFSGAFRVVTGQSVHSRYRYAEQDRLGRVSLGDLRLECVDVLVSGATVAIPRGPGLIHANFHLDSPTMTVVVRTHQSDEPELTYLPPGVAYDPAARSEALQKRIELLDTMHQVGHNAYLECIHTAIQRSDAYDGMAIVIRAGARVDEPTFLNLSDRLRTLHGDAADMIVRAVVEERRRGVIVRLRSAVVDPDERFFLAALLSFASRDELLRIMQLRYGGDACARVAKGVAHLLGGDEDRRIVSLAAVHAILMYVQAEDFAEWAARLWKRRLGDGEAQILGRYYKQVVRHPLLTPLLA